MKQLFSDFYWINPPDEFSIEEQEVCWQTKPQTDLWQRTGYGFRHDSASLFVTEVTGDFSFQLKTAYPNAESLYDQCGIVMYQNSEQWLKASVELISRDHAHLGAVLTQQGYSDWSSTDIPASEREMWYRLSRRGNDFYLENSEDGKLFKQMRLFHFKLETIKARIGVYACSPTSGSFQASFSEFELGPCTWNLK
ncbi:DUF1349 domain-containing protein [Sunxiuqinia elliptica]|uniref:DUF1349 domain-containing protein n=1 Tax=Sunxiuqinia elliptica TaxID=655355 RepID=A0A1I2HTK4_9BACT|nr:DUF1349 domain-containing protein [Sunxiuqinia elliptica]SFF31751.1 hypothetical protein SAMN05216283_104199 [Sunxiuqinia elliptica]